MQLRPVNMSGGPSQLSLADRGVENDTSQGSASKHEHSYPTRYTRIVTDPIERGWSSQTFDPPELLSLKVGSQVKLLIEISEALPVGSVGGVPGFYNAGHITVPGHAAETSEDGQKFSDNKSQEMKRYPLVQFSMPSETRSLLIMPESVESTLEDGQGYLRRTQLPLALDSADEDSVGMPE